MIEGYMRHAELRLSCETLVGVALVPPSGCLSLHPYPSLSPLPHVENKTRLISEPVVWTRCHAKDSRAHGRINSADKRSVHLTNAF